MEGNMSTLRTLEENGQTYAIVPLDMYNTLIEQAEIREDSAYLRAAMERGEEAFPQEFCEQLEELLRAGKPVIALGRNYRGFSQQELAKNAGISQSFLSQIESGKEASLSTLKALCDALNIQLEDVV
jgi:DNA-binding XRE family transcriptional regulator